MTFKNIDISAWRQVGEGGVGKTYVHPDDPDILLKVNKLSMNDENTVEDTDVTIEQIRAEFGDRVAALVASESEDYAPGVSEEASWHARKQAAIDRLARASRDAKMVALGDKLSNMRAIARDYAVQGDVLWSLFHTKRPEDHEWHYRGLADSLSELRDTFSYKEFEQLISQVFGERPSSKSA